MSIYKLVEFNKKERHLYTAVFDSLATSGGTRGIKIYFCFTDLRDEYGHKKAEYIIFNYLKSFIDLKLQKGDVVSFYARDIDFIKYSPSFRLLNHNDMCSRLLNPTKVKRMINPIERTNNHPQQSSEQECRVKVNYIHQ